jgi:hypothetical protein
VLAKEIVVQGGGYLVVVEEEPRLQRRVAKEVLGVGFDLFEALLKPECRHLAGFHRLAAGPTLRLLQKVLLLEERIDSREGRRRHAARFVAAEVSDEEILPHLARDQDEIVSHDVVAKRNREDGGTYAEANQTQPPDADFHRVGARQQDPDHQNRHHEEVIASREGGESEREPGGEPLPGTVSRPGCDEQKESQRDQEERQGDLQQQRVVVEEELVERREKPGEHCTPIVEDAPRDQVDEDNRDGIQDRLGEQNAHRSDTEDSVQRSEEVGVEWILVEDPIAEPIPREDLQGLLVVRTAVDHRKDHSGAGRDAQDIGTAERRGEEQETRTGDDLAVPGPTTCRGAHAQVGCSRAHLRPRKAQTRSNFAAAAPTPW